ncbi:MAG: glycine cleavage T C-terminal barrel domain-containing protein [Acidobacteriota bacterium]
MLDLEAGLRGAALVDVSDRSRIRVAGEERLEYLHRITAQAFQELVPPCGARAALLERTGKIVDVFTAHAFPDHVLLLGSRANQERALSWLRRYIFRSRVRVEDRTAATGQLLLTGPRSTEVAAALTGGTAVPLHGWAPIPGTASGLLIRTDAGGWLLLGEEEEISVLRARALQAGADHGLRFVGREIWTVLRILHGLPDGGAELDERTNPLEVGLDDSVSLTKGCFTGQEALAKMVTYSSVKRRLAGLRLPPGEPPAAGASLRSGGETVGRLTSATAVPGGDAAIALALVARSGVRPGDRLQVEGSAGDAEVVELPFPAVR